MDRDERCKLIIKELLLASDFLTVSHLAAISNYSTRSVHNLLNSDDFIRLLHGATLQKQQNRGIKLIATTPQRDAIYSELNLYVFQPIKNADDLQKTVLLLLTSTSHVTIDELSSTLFRSKTSVYPIMDEVETYLGKYHCTLSRKPNYGLSIEGSETNIRELFFRLVQQLPIKDHTPSDLDSRLDAHLYQQMLQAFPSVIINEVTDIVHVSEVSLNTHFCDYDFGMLTLRIAILISRNMNSHSLSEIAALNDTIQEYYVASTLRLLIEQKFHIQLPHQECFYIERMLLSTRKQVNQVSYNTFDDSIIESFIKLVSYRLNADFSQDAQLKANLINHLKPAIRRMKFGISSDNPLMDEIKEKYTEVYVAIITTIDQIEETEQVYFDSNEIGFICLHIVGALNRSKRIRSIKTLLICDSGITFESYLKSSVESTFSEIEVVNICNYGAFITAEHNYDLILNASPYLIEAANVIKIDLLFSQESGSKIRHWIFAKELNESRSLKEMFSDYLFYFKDDCNDQDELLNKYCQFLVQNDYITGDYLDSVKERMRHAETAIGRGVAVPHGSKKYVKKSIILIIKLDHPIPWDNQPVDLIFFAAIGDDVSNEYSKIFRKIAKIVSNDKDTFTLKSCNDLESIKKLLFDSYSID